MTPELSRSYNQQINFYNNQNIELYIKREDQIHPFISGNKYRKLKYNLIEAKALGIKTLLTFGGAFSNHIAAVAAVGKLEGFNTIGVIRGEELQSKVNQNKTLLFASNKGMKFKFETREVYRKKSSEAYIKALKEEFGEVYIIPEGGTNMLAIEGCKEIVTEADKVFDIICCPIGTGGTISGLINAVKPNQEVLGFSALKGDFLKDNISKFVQSSNWNITSKYHFGGYAKINKDLIAFLNQFYDNYNVPLDPIYTGKMMYGIFDMIKKKKFLNKTKILAIHTGGLQGIDGINFRLQQKKLPLINYV